MTDDEKIEQVTAHLTGWTPEINRELVISTCHMPGELAKEMDKGSDDVDFSYDRVDSGYIVYALAGNFRELTDAVALARAHGCKWLRLDADGPEVPGLKQWRW